MLRWRSTRSLPTHQAASTSFVIASPSCAVSVWLEDAVPDAKKPCTVRSNSTRRWRRRARWKSCSISVLDEVLEDSRRANTFVAMGRGRSSMRRDRRVGRPSNTIRARTTRRSRKARCRKTGNPSRPNRQKDKDARWTKKHERSYFGYKNHIGVDRRHKFVRRYVVSDASVHDSQKFEDVLDTQQHGFGRVGRQRLSQRMRSRKSSLSAA